MSDSKQLVKVKWLRDPDIAKMIGDDLDQFINQVEQIESDSETLNTILRKHGATVTLEIRGENVNSM